MTVNLDFLPVLAVSFIFMFARIGTIMMLAPALGERSVPTRFRLVIALLLTYVMLPVAQASYNDDMFASFPHLLETLVSEIAIGLFIGLASA